MATCSFCGKSGFGMLEIKYGACPSCRRAAQAAEAAKTPEERAAESVAKKKAVAASKTLLITTETWVGDAERLGVVAAEAVLGMNIIRDALANIRDLAGGRSGAIQKTLEEAREAALAEIRVKAARLGANAVIAVSINYHSISTGSATNMMMVAVTGTAVRV